MPIIKGPKKKTRPIDRAREHREHNEQTLQANFQYLEQEREFRARNGMDDMLSRFRKSRN